MASKFHSLADLAAAVQQDTNLQAELKADPAQALNRLAAPLQTDVWIYRIVVCALAAAVIVALLGAIALTWRSSTNPVPDMLTAIGSAAVGALAGLLAPSPKG